MNTQALMMAMKEKEMIALITDLMKYRQKQGAEKFKNVIIQMRGLLEINEDINEIHEQKGTNWRMWKPTKIPTRIRIQIKVSNGKKEIFTTRGVEMNMIDYHIFNKPFSQGIGLSFNKIYIKTNKVYIFPQEKEKATSIHTIFMKYAVRIITLDKNKKVIENKILERLKVYKPKYKYQYLLETRPENLKKVKPGEKMAWN